MGLAQRFSGWIRVSSSIPSSNPPTGSADIYVDGAGRVTVRQSSGLIVPVQPAQSSDAGVWSGGNASTVFTGQPLLRAGGAS